MNWGFEVSDGDDEFSAEAVERIRMGASPMADGEAAEALIERIAALMVSVSTDGPRIQEFNDEYKREHRALSAVLGRLRIGYPNRFSDLWRWHGRWSDGTLPSYQSRRMFIADLFDPVREAVAAHVAGTAGIAEGVTEDIPEDWPGIEQQAERLRLLWRQAQDADAYNAVGLQCVKLLTTLGHVVFEAPRDVPAGEVEPGRDDAKKRIGFFVQRVAPGDRCADIRKIVNGAYGQANSAKHRHAATRLDAGIAVNATLLVVSTVKLLAESDAPAPKNDDIPF